MYCVVTSTAKTHEHKFHPAQAYDIVEARVRVHSNCWMFGVVFCKSMLLALSQIQQFQQKVLET